MVLNFMFEEVKGKVVTFVYSVSLEVSHQLQ